jgi:coatomer subunit beta
MTSVIRVGQSKFVTHPIDEDSQERIINCIQTLSELGELTPAKEVFMKDTKAAYSKMLSAQEVKLTVLSNELGSFSWIYSEKGS